MIFRRSNNELKGAINVVYLSEFCGSGPVPVFVGRGPKFAGRPIRTAVWKVIDRDRTGTVVQEKSMAPTDGALSGQGPVHTCHEDVARQWDLTVQLTVGPAAVVVVIVVKPSSSSTDFIQLCYM